MGEGSTATGEDEDQALFDLKRIVRAMEGQEPPSKEKALFETKSDLTEGVTEFQQFDPSSECLSNAICEDGDRFGSLKINQKTGKEYGNMAKIMRNEIIRAFIFRDELIPNELRNVNQNALTVWFKKLTSSGWFPKPDATYGE
jgi:hypothetical protein